MKQYCRNIIIDGQEYAQAFFFETGLTGKPKVMSPETQNLWVAPGGRFLTYADVKRATGYAVYMTDNGYHDDRIKKPNRQNIDSETKCRSA